MQAFFLFWLAWVNAAALCACGWDKRQARRHARRVPERVLLWLCALGGSPAFLLGMAVFHHKTRKPKFLYGVPLLFAIQVLALFAVRALFSRPS